MKRTLGRAWRPATMGVLLVVAVVATAGAVGALRAGQEAASVPRMLVALLAFLSAWLLAMPAALR